MRRYLAQCFTCEAVWERTYSIEEWEALPRDKTHESKIMGSCEDCGAQVLQVQLTAPQVIFNHEITTFNKPGFNIAHGHRTPKQQEAFYAKMMAKKRKRAADTKEARKGTRRPDNEIRHIGSMPIEMDVALRREHGQRCMEHETKDMLKKHGCLFDT